MYVDFIDLKNTCPKDSYSLPSFVMLVNGASSNEILTMMYAHLEYNQILMKKSDEKNMKFITDQGTFYYRVMPFRQTTQCQCHFTTVGGKFFKHQINRNVSTCVDDTLMKSAILANNFEDLKETRETLLRAHGMKLNSYK